MFDDKKISKQEAVILLSQMYLPWFDEKEKEAITMAIESLQTPEEHRETHR